MKKTEIMLELSLYFDNDNDVADIIKYIGLKPSDFKNRKDTRINPITGLQNPGYITYSTEYVKTLMFEEVAVLLLNSLSDYLFRIKECLIKFDGEADFCIVPILKEEIVPALTFDRNFLDLVNYLNATIQIDMYIEYKRR